MDIAFTDCLESVPDDIGSKASGQIIHMDQQGQH